MITEVQGKKVLVRVDFNVPLNKQHEITDDTRIKNALPTLKTLLDNGAALILMSHLGRPQKKKLADGSIDVEKFSLKYLVPHLSDVLGTDVLFANDCIGQEAFDKSLQLKAGQVLLLENTRFHAGESKGDIDMAAKLAKLGDIYINDAFGTAHRAHASTTIVTKFFKPQDRSIGLLMENEISNAKKVISSPQRPATAILGGAKVSDKIKLIDRLIDFVDHILIGGGMSYTFFKAQGLEIGNSICEDEYLDLAIELLAKAEDQNVKIHLPEDTRIADKFAADAENKVVDSTAIPSDWEGLDVGTKAIEAYSEIIKQSKTVLWNGPLGVFEMEAFSKGTFAVAAAVAEATKTGTYTLIGGGDSVSAINKAGLADEVSFVSTGGGAMLEFLEGKTLPAIAAMESKEYIES